LLRVLSEAEAAGLSQRVRALVGDLGSFKSDVPLRAVVCSLSALASLTKSERARALALLKDATIEGGVHVVEGPIGGRSRTVLNELVASYAGWRVSMEDGAESGTFVAYKDVA
jgi:hypothetical protein